MSREGQYKKGITGKTKDKTRARTMASRNEKKNQMGMQRRGIQMVEESDEENDMETNVAPAKPNRLQRLQEYRKQKEAKKLVEQKTKRPPFRVGTYQGFGNVGPMGKTVLTSI